MADALKDHFRMLATYNRAANEQLLDACSRLSAEELQQPSAAPFSTIPALLEHVLASDEVWLARFQGDPSAKFRPGPAVERSLTEFHEAREAMDDRIEVFVDGLDPRTLGRALRIVNSRGESRAPLSRFLTHMFNHQTHHRGQVQVLLRAAGVMGVSLDLHRLVAD